MHQILLIALVLPCVMAALPLSEDEYGPAEPYNFGYKVHDKDGDQWRTEVSDGHGKVEGSYGYVDNLGMTREVHYVADDDGFRATVKTNEPGVDSPSPADVLMNASPPSDYDATIYGIEALPETRANLKEKFSPHIKAKNIDLPGQADPKAFYRYQRFAEQSVPPIYVVDGHLQSPWFPMESA